MTSNDLASAAQLAFGSYFDLPAGTPSTVILKDAGKGMAAVQAGAFSSRYTVAIPTFHDPLSNLDVTVFKDTGNNLTLAIRGTLPGHDLTVTDAQIATQGAAFDQIVALYNWGQRVSRSGSPATQFALVEYPNAHAVLPPAGAVPLFSTSAAFGGQSMYLVQAPSITASGELVAAMAADLDQRIDVTGHSLGGHLALAFNALFTSQVGLAIGFDTPGFIDSATNQQFFAALGGAVPTQANSADFISVVADEARIGDAPFNGIAGLHSRPGVPVDIAIEDQWLSDEPLPDSPARNHSMKMLADSLAVYNLLSTLDPSLTAARYKVLLNAAADGTAGSCERLIDAMESLLQAKPELLPVGNGQRDALYEALYAVQASAAPLVGKVRIDASSAELRDKARDDFSALASVVKLSPVVLTGLDVTLDTQLKAAWGTTYTDWLADKSLSQAGRDAGKATFSEQWLADRAAMLDTLVRANQDDEAFYNDRTLKDVWLYNDEGSHTRIARQPGGPGTFVQHRIEFGAQAADALVGDNAGDRLYGGAGTDALTGQGGDDHLEGNAGADTLDGGADNDMLVGGAEADTIHGGAGHDTLLGGADAGAYRFSAGWGADTIDDGDGLDAIEVDGLGPLTGKDAKKVAENAWQIEDKRVNYTLVGADAARNDLYISFSDRTDTIHIRNWSVESLGITLADIPAPLATGSIYRGDFDNLLRLADRPTYSRIRFAATCKEKVHVGSTV